MAKTVIVGPSCAGKSTYAWSSRGDDDLVVDYDRIAQALGCSEPHAATGDIGRAAFRARLAAIRIAISSESDSWVIHTNPDGDQIDEYIDAGFRFHVIDPGMDVCLDRCETANRPEGTADRIRDWYDSPPDFPDTAAVTIINESENSMGGSRQRIDGGQSASLRSRLAKTHGIDVRAASGNEPASADVYIFEEISSSSWWGVSGKTFADLIGGLDVEQINVHINSAGGSAYDGIAIMNTLKHHKATTRAYVDGLAASAASIIAMGADTVTMSTGAQMMIHDPWIYMAGDAVTLREEADALDKLADSMADIYASKAGGESSTWRDTMRAEKWYTAREAVEAGLADEWDETEDSPDPGNSLRREFYAQLRGTGHAPQTPATEPVTTHQQEKEASMNTDALISGLRDRLGITEPDVDEDQILNMIDNKVNIQTPPDGAVLIEAEALAELQANAKAGREARDELAKNRHKSIVSKAISEGRVSTASRDKWLNQLAKDEDGTVELINSFPVNTIPVEEIGHGVDSDTAPDIYALAWGTESKENA